MAVIYKDIRQALEVRLASITGIPDISWENDDYTPTTGTNFVQCVFNPVLREPAVRGLNPQQFYTGNFLVNCFTSADEGPGACDTLANLIIENFEATTDLTANGKTISIRSAERRMGYKDGAFYMVPVVIYWYIYS